MRVVTVLRKPLEGTVAQNVLEHGCGGMNIDACRIEAVGGLASGGLCTGESALPMNKAVSQKELRERSPEHKNGRFPTNLVLQHLECSSATCVEECPVDILNQQAGTLTSGKGAVKRNSSRDQEGNRGSSYGKESRPDGAVMTTYGDSGSLSRYFKQIGKKVR